MRSIPEARAVRVVRVAVAGCGDADALAVRGHGELDVGWLPGGLMHSFVEQGVLTRQRFPDRPSDREINLPRMAFHVAAVGGADARVR